MPTIADILKLRYPTEFNTGNIQLQDDGKGPYVKLWKVIDVDKPTNEQILAMVNDKTYLTNLAIYNRLNAPDGYPSIADQLDLIYEQGINGWKTVIAAVKQRYPKPV